MTVDSTREAALPAGRYFHAAAMVAARRELYVHGGLGALRGPAEGPFGCRSTALRDLWAFSLKAHRWEQVVGGGRGPFPPPLAGHALVLRHGRGRPQALLLVGGLEPCRGPLDHVWNFDLDARLWTRLNVSGFWPPGENFFIPSKQSFYSLFSRCFWPLGRLPYAHGRHLRIWGIRRTPIGALGQTVRFPRGLAHLDPFAALHRVQSARVARCKFYFKCEEISFNWFFSASCTHFALERVHRRLSDGVWGKNTPLQLV